MVPIPARSEPRPATGPSRIAWHNAAILTQEPPGCPLRRTCVGLVRARARRARRRLQGQLHQPLPAAPGDRCGVMNLMMDGTRSPCRSTASCLHQRGTGSGHRLPELQQRDDVVRGVPQRQRHADIVVLHPARRRAAVHAAPLRHRRQRQRARCSPRSPKAPTNGNIQLSVFNAAVNQPTVDIYVTAPGTDITQINPSFSYVSFNGVVLQPRISRRAPTRSRSRSKARRR